MVALSLYFQTTLSTSRNNSFTSFAVENYRLSAVNIQPPTAPPSESSRHTPFNNTDYIQQMAYRNSCADPQIAPCTLDLEIAELERQLDQIRLKFQGIPGELEWEEGVPGNPRVVPRMGTRLCNSRLRGRNRWRVSDEEACTMKVQVRERTSNLLPSCDRMEDENPATDTSTSAYNTGDSSCSTPLAIIDQAELDKRLGLISIENRTNDLNLNLECFPSQNTGKIPENSTIICPKTTNGVHDFVNSDSITSRDHVDVTANSVRCSDHATTAAANHTRRCHHVPNMANGDLNLTRTIWADYIGVMYTNLANLDHTIMVQQRLFDERLQFKGGIRKETVQGCYGPVQNSSELWGNTHLDDEKPPHCEEKNLGGKLVQEMEWVVKCRSDGTRYITRRPAKRCQAKKHQKKLKEQDRDILSSGKDVTTTNDVTVGRRWSREERRRHVAASRHRRLSKEKLVEERVEEGSGPMNGPWKSLNPCGKNVDTSGPVMGHLPSRDKDLKKRRRSPLLSVTII